VWSTGILAKNAASKCASSSGRATLPWRLTIASSTHASWSPARVAGAPGKLALATAAGAPVVALPGAAARCAAAGAVLATGDEPPHAPHAIKRPTRTIVRITALLPCARGSPRTARSTLIVGANADGSRAVAVLGPALVR